MKNTILLLLLSFMTICACEAVSADSLLIQPQESSTTIPLSEALASLDQMLVELSISTKSSNNKSYSISSVNPIGRLSFIQTKAGDLAPNIPDTLMYLVNFDDNNGFAVLAGDRRLGEQVYCVTENGAISSDDFNEALNYINSTSTMTSTSEDDDSFVDIGQLIVPAMMLSSMLADIEYGCDTIDGTKAAADIVQTYNLPLLTSKWHQHEPFNDLNPIFGGNHASAGCSAIALAQVMLYCQKPASPVFDGVNCSWATMNTVCPYWDLEALTATTLAKQQVAHFLKHISTPSLCDIEYTSEGKAKCAIDDVVKSLKYYGYKNVTKYTGFGTTNQARVSTMLHDNLPVIMAAKDFHNGGAHIWVIDGEWNGHFHCNWGWNGTWDGYYSKHNYFDFQYRRGYDSTDPGTTESKMANRSYDWWFRVITYSV